MVIDKPGYEHLIQFLTENLALFEQAGTPYRPAKSVGEFLEECIAEQIIQLCTQHTELEMNHRSLIIREVDGIVYDFQEVLGSVLDNEISCEQAEIIHEIALLIKNLFDNAVAALLD
ncbi:MAG: DUF3802 family protein [Alkalimonas sp.]|uniref:DUF3802 family protein n=1 Tax=Alkalimonas delamerensis TaxID=265981 RepID=A0ABT9GLQ4_9GAMM|nr:DUF3802 family protein [Alkalimonas delamerensis]MCC5853028.1 DUF3802 family protein [Alkalimonas sp.]MDP4527899.1 DUF3802 family protein [Alkalimonas delamerensis]